MTFLTDPPESPEVQALYDEDVEGDGFVMNLTRVWAHDPATYGAFTTAVAAAGTDLSVRERGILVAATAATTGDSYCALAWGTRLARERTPEIATAVLAGTDDGLTDAETALARWARAVAGGATSTTDADVQLLRDAGYADARIVALTTYIVLRMAFSTVNGALGATPDRQLADAAPPVVRDAVTWGRPVS